jgi:putative hydrolase of the HAD superfamily
VFRAFVARAVRQPTGAGSCRQRRSERTGRELRWWYRVRTTCSRHRGVLASLTRSLQVVGEAVSAITLDAGGVLLLPDPAAMNEALAAFGTTPDETACWRAHYEMMRVLDETAEPDYVVVSQLMAAALGVPPDRCAAAGPVVSETYLSSRWVPAPGAAEALQRLESNGYSLAVISNSTHGQIASLLDEAGLCSTSGPGTRVVAILDSGAIGIEKPDPRIFELALAELGVAPDRCIHIGDSIPLDVHPAQTAGIAAVHIDPYTACSRTDHEDAATLAAFVDRLLG